MHNVERELVDLRFEDLLEDVLEAAVVAFEDGVLGAHVERPLLLQGVLEAAVGEAADRLEEKGVTMLQLKV